MRIKLIDDEDLVCKVLSDRLIAIWNTNMNQAHQCIALLNDSKRPRKLPKRLGYWCDKHDKLQVKAFKLFKNWKNAYLQCGHVIAFMDLATDKKSIKAVMHFYNFVAQRREFNCNYNLRHGKFLKSYQNNPVLTEILIRRIVKHYGSGLLCRGPIYDTDINGEPKQSKFYPSLGLKVASLFYSVLLVKDKADQILRFVFIFDHKVYYNFFPNLKLFLESQIQSFKCVVAQHEQALLTWQSISGC